MEIQTKFNVGETVYVFEREFNLIRDFIITDIEIYHDLRSLQTRICYMIESNGYRKKYGEKDMINVAFRSKTECRNSLIEQIKSL